MEFDVREISNAVMIDSLDSIIQRESWKLKADKNTGLLAKVHSETSEVDKSLVNNENLVSTNAPILNGTKGHLSQINHSNVRDSEIERLANVFTQSPSFFTKNINNNRINVKHNQDLLNKNMITPTHNEFHRYKDLLNNKNNKSVSPDIKVRRNVRFGEYSPLNPANQVNSQPFIGIGEYEDKRKKLLELQRKEYIEYLSKSKQEKNISDLPKLAAFSCEEAFRAALETRNPEQNKVGSKAMNQEGAIKVSPVVDGIESCALDDGRQKETNRLKQENYRLELSKQIEEKKRMEQERKRKEQLEDEAIERAARDQEDKIKKEYEKEIEKRTMAELQKQLQQEKLKNEMMEKQKSLAAAEMISQQQAPIKHVKSCNNSLAEDDDDDDEVFNCPSQDTFDDVPLPTNRVRAPRKIDYRDVSCNTDTFKNPCMNQNVSPPVTRHKAERAYVSFASDPPLKRNVNNPAALLPVTKSVIIDSPLTLALAGLENCDEDSRTCEAIEPTEAVYRNQVFKEQLGSNHSLPTDKHLLSNLGNIRKQLDIEHQKLKQQVRRSQ